MNAPTGFAVLTAEGHFVGIWRDRETAEKIVNRSPSAKGERIVEYRPAEPLTEDAARLDWLQKHGSAARDRRCGTRNLVVWEAGDIRGSIDYHRAFPR